MATAERSIAVCEQCGSVYAGMKGQSGNVRPIGTKFCSCGSESFRKWDGSISVDD